MVLQRLFMQLYLGGGGGGGGSVIYLYKFGA